jgi:hypothetical protein
MSDSRTSLGINLRPERAWPYFTLGMTCQRRGGTITHHLSKKEEK